MTTPAIPEVVEIDPEAPKTPDQNGPKELREALAREKETSHKYRAQLLTGVFEEIGLNPEVELGKAIAKEYDGDPTVEALTEYAKTEYGYEAPKSDENPKQTQITEAQTKLDALNTQSQSVTPASESEALKEAQVKGDFATAGAIKARRMEKMFLRR